MTTGAPPLVRIVWGTGTGPTAVAAYDAALADAGIHNYNLITVSSIIPAGTDVEAVGTAPNLGPAGDKLTVVQAKAAVDGPGSATAGIGWTTGDGPGVIYESGGELDPAVVRNRIREGLSAARSLRDWSFDDEDVRDTTVRADHGEVGVAVAAAVLGSSEPLL